ncbi:hypothetical protein [Nannocystis pusilla]|uniref:hypothetical protein n=1 Tax=Nannocystis pusilla TaxID=889268 RepID=UPI003B7672CF
MRKLIGARRVKGVQLEDGKILRCDLVALAPDPAPAFELAAQAGAPIHFTGAGFAPVVDADGRIAAGPAAHPLEAEGAQTAPPRRGRCGPSASWPAPPPPPRSAAPSTAAPPPWCARSPSHLPRRTAMPAPDLSLRSPPSSLLPPRGLP